MMKSEITTSIWFCAHDGDISAVLAYYKALFHDDLEFGEVRSLGETPNGRTEMVEVRIFGRPFSLMNTEKEHHAMNDSVSLIIHCPEQQDIDNYWDYLTAEGRELHCGWCIDKFGLRWQILPHNLAELMALPNADRVMLRQTKIVIEDFMK